MKLFIVLEQTESEQLDVLATESGLTPDDYAKHVLSEALSHERNRDMPSAESLVSTIATAQAEFDSAYADGVHSINRTEWMENALRESHPNIDVWMRENTLTVEDVLLFVSDGNQLYADASAAMGRDAPNRNSWVGAYTAGVIEGRNRSLARDRTNEGVAR